MTLAEVYDIGAVFDRDVTDPDHDILLHSIEFAAGITGGCLACGGGCVTWWTRWSRGREVCCHELLSCRVRAGELLTAALAGRSAEPAQARSRGRGRGVYARGEKVASDLDKAPTVTVSVLGPGPARPGTASRFYVPGRTPTPWYAQYRRDGVEVVCPRSSEHGARDLAVWLIAGGVDRVLLVDPDDGEHHLDADAVGIVG